MSKFHTFGCPCYVLDHWLQSGNGAVPKWGTRARMGIYVGCSPSHASNIALILNPRTGHLSPQFHVVFNDDFTTVPYLRTSTVPPHWADLVRSSAMIQMYTEKQVGTWQSIPDLETEQGDFLGKNQLLSISNQDREGVEDSAAHSNCSKQRVSLRISLVLMKRSITQLLLSTVPKIYGICQHQSILIPVDYITLPGLKF
jgi:hypothetical protein